MNFDIFQHIMEHITNKRNNSEYQTLYFKSLYDIKLHVDHLEQ